MCVKLLVGMLPHLWSMWA